MLLTLLIGCDFTNERRENCHNACVRAYERAYLTDAQSPTIRADDEACHTECEKL